MVSKKLKNKAIKLRKLGFSYKYIESSLGIRRSTLSNWFSGKPYNPNKYTLDKIRNGPKISAEIRKQAKLNRIEQIHQEAKQKLGNLTQRDLLLLGIGLYMGEGSKTHDILRFSNSDPAMIKLFIVWMKNHFMVANQNFTLRVHTYPDTNIEEIEKYWLKVTKLPTSSLRKTIIDKRTKGRAKLGKLPHGTAHVTIIASGQSIHGVRLFRLIQGYIISVTKNFAGIV